MVRGRRVEPHRETPKATLLTSCRTQGPQRGLGAMWAVLGYQQLPGKNQVFPMPDGCPGTGGRTGASLYQAASSAATSDSRVGSSSGDPRCRGHREQRPCRKGAFSFPSGGPGDSHHPTHSWKVCCLRRGAVLRPECSLAWISFWVMNCSKTRWWHNSGCAAVSG